ncbi:hypothetical protein GF337_18425 [candidate division KSB1 bacterium]|nr:hypothetical protein [candidate division KSB1 bacterium]
MKKIITVCLALLFVANCVSLQKLIKKEKSPDEMPLLIGNHEPEIVSTEKKETATVEEKKVIEGMTMEMVEKSWGIPDNREHTTTGLLVWEYGDEKLYFLEEILVATEKR